MDSTIASVLVSCHKIPLSIPLFIIRLASGLQGQTWICFLHVQRLFETKVNSMCSLLAFVTKDVCHHKSTNLRWPRRDKQLHFSLSYFSVLGFQVFDFQVFDFQVFDFQVFYFQVFDFQVLDFCFETCSIRLRAISCININITPL